jgi:hypothetical protein
LTLQWLLASLALLIAVVALMRARRAIRRVERLTESYWELRYDHGQLRARVARLDDEASPAEPDPAPPTGSTAFVPLSSLKR